MIIELSTSLIKNRKNEKQFNLFLSNILLAYREGKHLILISRRNIFELLKGESIEEYNRKILIRYKKELGYTRKNLEKYVDNIVFIIPDNENEEVIKKDNLKIRKLKINTFLDSESIQKTILLCEDESDVEVYTLLGKFYVNELSLHDKFKLQHDVLSGGGDNINKPFKRIYNSKSKFCLTILDSDRISPENDIGDTARKIKLFVESIEKNKKNSKCHYIILDYLELENIMPFKFYKQRNQDIYKELKSLKEIDVNVLKYFDFKKGVKRKNDKIAYNKYWSELLNDENFKINGFQNKNYKILLEFIKLDHKEIFEMVENDEDIKKEWLTLGKTITSFLLGTSRKLI